MQINQSTMLILSEKFQHNIPFMLSKMMTQLSVNPSFLAKGEISFKTETDSYPELEITTRKKPST